MINGHDVYLPTTLSVNQFVTSPISTEADTVEIFLSLPAGSSTTRSRLFAVRSSIQQNLIGVCARGFQTIHEQTTITKPLRHTSHR